MINLDEIRAYMREQAEIDRGRQRTQVTAHSLEEALSQAALELGVPVKRIEYELLQRPSHGFLGIGRQDCMIIAYVTAEKSVMGEEEISMEAHDEWASEVSQVKDKDGEVVVRFAFDGVMMKVNPPVGAGKKAAMKDAEEVLKDRAVHKYDKTLVQKMVKAADGITQKVADFIRNPANDSIMTIELLDFNMKAEVTVRRPGPGGIDPDSATVIDFLKNNGVIHGINEERLAELEDYPVYDEPVVIAEGSKPVNGNDARIIYNFETNRSDVKLKEKNGRVDFKEMNLITNVVEGQILAQKVPLEEGKPGRTVTGKLLTAKRGSDVDLGIGKNVSLSSDGRTLKSDINGQVVMTGEKVNVEPVYVVPGDVNMKNGGNVIFLGTVMVKGSVDDGFKVKASGNIEVMGNVGKAELDAEGDIIVHQGITGKSGGHVIAGQGVWAKFIENATIESGDIVVASDGIINSQVSADNKIVCRGKRATIVGGRLRASELIHAKTFGSLAGSETILEVGIDPKRKARLLEIEESEEVLQKELEDVEMNIHTLERLKRTKKDLGEDKEAFLKEQKARELEIKSQFAKITEEKNEIKDYIRNLRGNSRIAASKQVFPGVRVMIKEAELFVRNEFKAVTFLNEENTVKISRYEEPEDEIPAGR